MNAEIYARIANHKWKDEQCEFYLAIAQKKHEPNALAETVCRVARYKAEASAAIAVNIVKQKADVVVKRRTRTLNKPFDDARNLIAQHHNQYACHYEQHRTLFVPAATDHHPYHRQDKRQPNKLARYVIKEIVGIASSVYIYNTHCQHVERMKIAYNRMWTGQQKPHNYKKTQKQAHGICVRKSPVMKNENIIPFAVHYNVLLLLSSPKS